MIVLQLYYIILLLLLNNFVLYAIQNRFFTAIINTHVSIQYAKSHVHGVFMHRPEQNVAAFFIEADATPAVTFLCTCLR